MNILRYYELILSFTLKMGAELKLSFFPTFWWKCWIIHSILDHIYIKRFVGQSVSVWCFVCPRGTNNLFVPRWTNIYFTQERGANISCTEEGTNIFALRGGDKHFLTWLGANILCCRQWWPWWCWWRKVCERSELSCEQGKHSCERSEQALRRC